MTDPREFARKFPITFSMSNPTIERRRGRDGEPDTFHLHTVPVRGGLTYGQALEAGMELSRLRIPQGGGV